MTGDSELETAQRLRDEAAEDRKAAAADREAAATDRAQIEHRHRQMEQLEQNIAAREKALKQAGEPEFIRRGQEAAKALADARALMASYDKDRHSAMIALQSIDTRERAEREQSAA
jgi:hypothetical protein